MSAAELTVVVADDHPLFLEGLVTALSDNGIRVVAAVGTGEDAVAAVARASPDVAVIDLVMPGAGGLEATRRIAREARIPVLVLTMSDDDASLFAALRAGARGYMLKEAAGADIARAIRSVAQGEAVIGAGVSARVLDAAATPALGAAFPFPQLTARERAVLELVARGYDNARVAARLGMSDKTVRNHVSAILTKLPAATRAEAVATARDHGLGVDG